MTIPYLVASVPVVATRRQGTNELRYWIAAKLDAQLKPGEEILLDVRCDNVSFRRPGEATTHRMVEIAPMPRELLEAITS